VSLSRFGPPADGAPGFRTVVALSRLLLVVGRLPAGDHGPVHLHYGEEILHVLSGRLLVRHGDDERECGPGDTVAVPAGVRHGFDALEETVLEVVAEPGIGTVYPVRRDDGEVDLVEVFRRDMPWGRPPPDGVSWTDDPEMARVLRTTTGR
jgi:mannose-6-phosphate isomerase-like protein (cupin superfamily)